MLHTEVSILEPKSEVTDSLPRIETPTDYEQVLYLIKPDGLRVMGEIIDRIQRLGLVISELKMVKANRKLLQLHYGLIGEVGVRHGEKVLERVIKSMKGKKVVAMVIEGINAIEALRKLNGPTQPLDAPPGTIRGDYGTQNYAYAGKRDMAIENLVHASATWQEAIEEIKVWFL